MQTEGRAAVIPVEISGLLASCGLIAGEPVGWGDDVPETGPGIYIIAVDTPDGRPHLPDYLPEEVCKRWRHRQSIVYIGKAGTSLRKRLRQFYRQKHGNRAPHRGGQDVLLLKTALHVHWAATPHPALAERLLIEAFSEAAHGLPFGNRVRPRPKR
jgi:hypothetical protein